jgi:SOS response regulatory protein OraA/RecX
LAPQLGKNNQMMIKVSDTLVAAFGASNPADFASKLEGVLAELPGLKNKIEEVAASSESIRSKLDEIDAKATENESIADLLNAHTLTQDSAFAASVRNIAATAGSQVASEALAKTGTNPVAPSGSERKSRRARNCERRLEESLGIGSEHQKRVRERRGVRCLQTR